MKLINPLGIPWNEYLAMHVREIAVAIVLATALLIASAFLDLPGGTTLTGRVTSQGKPVVFGTVTLLTSDHRTVFVPIRPDGTFLVKGVPRGPVRIAVSSPDPRPITERQAVEPESPGSGSRGRPSGPTTKPPLGKQVSGRHASTPGQDVAVEGISIAATNEQGPTPAGSGQTHPRHEGWFRIPGRYANPATSGIGTEVRRGRTTLDLSLD